jgi:hypothetical protein
MVGFWGTIQANVHAGSVWSFRFGSKSPIMQISLNQKLAIKRHFGLTDKTYTS